MGLTIAQLTQAIRTKVDMGMETVVAENIAEHALGFFGFSNRIIDNASVAIASFSRKPVISARDMALAHPRNVPTSLWRERSGIDDGYEEPLF